MNKKATTTTKTFPWKLPLNDSVFWHKHVVINLINMLMMGENINSYIDTNVTLEQIPRTLCVRRRYTPDGMLFRYQKHSGWLWSCSVYLRYMNYNTLFYPDMNCLCGTFFLLYWQEPHSILISLIAGYSFLYIY